MGEFEKDWHWFSFRCSVEFTNETIWSWAFPYCEGFDDYVIGLCRFSIHDLVLVAYMLLGILPCIFWIMYLLWHVTKQDIFNFFGDVYILSSMMPHCAYSLYLNCSDSVTWFTFNWPSQYRISPTHLHLDVCKILIDIYTPRNIITRLKFICKTK